jgi:putative oxidoreductase
MSMVASCDTHGRLATCDGGGTDCAPGHDMTPLTHAPVHPVVHDVHDAPTGIRAHLPNITLALLRVVAGLMFAQHGVQKLFGALLPPDRPFTGGPDMFSQMWFAGVLELGGGLLVALGLFTRPVAFILAGEMAVAYFMVHNPQGFWPILNGGELAVLYCFIFLMYAAIGGGRFSVDQAMHGNHSQPTVVERDLRPIEERRDVPVRSTDVEVPVERSRTTREP